MTHDTDASADRIAPGAGRPGPSRRLAIAVGAVVVIVLAGIGIGFLFFDEVGVSGFERTDDTVLFPELHERRGDISALTVSTAAESFEIRRDGSEWVLMDRDGYPVPDEQVEAILDFLDGLRGLYASTVDPPDYAQYRVALPDEGTGGAGQTIRIVDGGGNDLAEFTIGITLSVPTDGGVASLTAVRRGRDARIRLVDDTISLPQDAESWLDRRIVNVAAADILELVIDGPDVAPFPIARGEEGELVIDGQRTRADLASPWVLDQIMASLQSLNFVDVRTASALERLDPAPWVVTVATAAGLRYTLTVYQLGDAHWTTFAAEAEDEAAADDAAYFNARHGGWAYRLPPSPVDRLKTGPAQLR